MSRSIVHDGFNLSGWQSSRNGSDNKLLSFSPVEPIDFVMSDADGAASMVVRVPHEDKKIPQRPFPTLIGFNGYRPVDPEHYGVATFAEIAPARVSKVSKGTSLAIDGAIVFACPDQTALKPFKVVTENGKSVWTLDHRIIGVYRVIRELETAINAAPDAICMVQRLPGLTLLCQAAGDVDEGEAGVFRIHSINTIRGSGEFPERAGGEPEYEYDPGKKTLGVAHVRAFNRFGDVSEDDWRIVTVVDGVLSVVGGGGVCTCPVVWVLSAHGAITGGTAEFDLTLKDASGNDVTEPITIDFNTTAAAVQTAIEGHSAYGLGDSPTVASVHYGPVLSREIHIRWTGDIEPPPIDSSSLDGDSGCAIRSGSFRPGEES